MDRSKTEAAGVGGKRPPRFSFGEIKMTDENVVDFKQYKMDAEAEEQLPGAISEDIPETFKLIETIGSELFEAGIQVYKGQMPSLILKWGDNEYGFTIRPLESHYENLDVWKTHVLEKYQSYCDTAQPDEVPIDLTVEEIMILNEEFGEPEESGGK